MFQVEGLCGNMNGRLDDDYTASSGITTPLGPFVSSWKVNPCGGEDSLSQTVKPCTIKSNNAEVAHDLCKWIGDELVFGECRDAIDWRRFRKSCEYDMCARESPDDNTPLCLMVVAMAHACKDVGITVDWQSQAELRDFCACESYNKYYDNMQLTSISKSLY